MWSPKLVSSGVRSLETKPIISLGPNTTKILKHLATIDQHVLVAKKDCRISDILFVAVAPW